MQIRGSPATIRTHLICRISAIETIPNNHSPFFWATIKTNPYSQTFITAVKKQKICARSPLSLSGTQSQRQSNLCNVWIDFSKQPLKSSEHRQTWFHHPAIFLQHQTIIMNCTAFLTQINSFRSSMKKSLKEGQQKQYDSMQHKSQNESIYELKTDLSASLSSPPTSLLSTVRKNKQHITAKRLIGVCHQLSPSTLRSARIALYSIMQQLFLPEFRYIKGSTTPEDSTSNLPVESSSKRIKKDRHLLSLSPFFDEDNHVIHVGGRLANSPYSVDK